MFRDLKLSVEFLFQRVVLVDFAVGIFQLLVERVLFLFEAVLGVGELLVACVDGLFVFGLQLEEFLLGLEHFLFFEQFGVFFRFLFECFSVALSLFQDVLAAVGDGLFEKGI